MLPANARTAARTTARRNMFGGKEKEDGDAFFKPVRNPRRPRDAPEEDESEAKGQAKDGGEDKGGSEVAAQGGADGSKPGRRRRAGDEQEADAKQGDGGGNSWMTSPEKRTQTNKLLIEQDELADENATKGGGGGGGGGGSGGGSGSGGGKRDKFFNEAEQDDIIMIPDLDEDGADADHRVAHAPRNVHRKIPSLADLESEVKQAVASAEEGFDLAILLRTLVPPTLVQEADETRTFESLLREVTDELTLTPKTVVAATISSSASKEAKEKEKAAKSAASKSSKKA